jgi:hypothetical protein
MKPTIEGCQESIQERASKTSTHQNDSAAAILALGFCAVAYAIRDLAIAVAAKNRESEPEKK